MPYTDWQVEVLTSLGLLGACVQFALVLIACVLGVMTVKALW